MIRKGKGTKEIAALLNISVKTVQFHKTCLMQTLDIHGTAGLMCYSSSHGLATEKLLAPGA